jgi:hypothetical protein
MCNLSMNRTRVTRAYPSAWRATPVRKTASSGCASNRARTTFVTQVMCRMYLLRCNLRSGLSAVIGLSVPRFSGGSREVFLP